MIHLGRFVVALLHVIDVAEKTQRRLKLRLLRDSAFQIAFGEVVVVRFGVDAGEGVQAASRVRHHLQQLLEDGDGLIPLPRFSKEGAEVEIRRFLLRLQGDGLAESNLCCPIIASEGMDSTEEGIGLVGLGGQLNGALAGLQGRIQIALLDVQTGQLQMQEAGTRLGTQGPAHLVNSAVQVILFLVAAEL